MQRARNTADPEEEVRLTAHNERFFNAAGENASNDKQWFYRAREGTFGPFSSREDAERDLSKRLHPCHLRNWRISHALRNFYRSWFHTSRR